MRSKIVAELEVYANLLQCEGSIDLLLPEIFCIHNNLFCWQPMFVYLYYMMRSLMCYELRGVPASADRHDASTLIHSQGDSLVTIL